MPELPEVETIVSDLRPLLTGRRIESVRLTLDRMVRYPSPRAFVRRLRHRRIEAVHRRGKYIVMPLEQDQRLVIHLGMTGHLRVVEPGDPLARHTHLRMGLDDRRELRFDDQRQFGRLLPGAEAELLGAGAMPRLGPEPIHGDLTEPEFGRLVRSRHRPVKAALLDQSFLAGVGNIYADEACFRARIRPSRRTDRLTVAERRGLYAAIQEVLSSSIAARGSSIINYVDGFGIPGNNQGQLLVYGRGGEPCVRCGSLLTWTRLAGRGTVYCRQCQR